MALSFLLVAVAGLAVGAGAGYVVDQRDRPVTSVAPAPTGPAPDAVGGADTLAEAKPAGRFGPTSGTLERVDAAGLAVRTAAGVVDVPLGAAVTVQRLANAARAELKTGDAVMARGESDGQGKITVRQLQILPPDGPPFSRAAAGRSGEASGATPGGRIGAGPPGTGVKSGIAAGGPGAGGTLAPAGAGSAVVGTVERVAGDQVTLAAPSGSVAITVPDAAQVQRLTSASQADLVPGQSVSIFAAPNGGALVTIIAG
jgi:hypothetical protein